MQHVIPLKTDRTLLCSFLNSGTCLCKQYHRCVSAKSPPSPNISADFALTGFYLHSRVHLLANPDGLDIHEFTNAKPRKFTPIATALNATKR
jgi:hypothetical protein